MGRSEKTAGGRPGLRRSESDPWMDERVDDRRRMQSSLRRGPYRVNSRDPPPMLLGAGGQEL
jgi:hypothetical protein